jgi:hypothetical protein
MMSFSLSGLRRVFALAVLNAGLFGLGLTIPGQVALAGHEFAVNGNGGDCWRAGTPENCRTAYYSGDLKSIHIRIINQLSNATLWNNTVTACSNWNSSPGPQYCSSTPVTNDSWDYFKRDDTLPPPNGYTWNCVSGACPNANPMDIQWTEIYLTIGDNNYGNLTISISGHEIGHSLGLDHHGPAGSNQALMTQGTTLQSPNNIDIGPLPACTTNPVGSNGTGGVRCVYHATY